MANKSPVKLNKKHKGKEFKSRFHLVGKVKPHRKQDENKSWFDVPYFEEKLTTTKKPRRVLTFTIETDKSNDLKIEVAGMEQKFAYPYSQTHKKSFTVNWSDRLDKTKFPDDTYHIINETEYDRTKTIGDKIETGQWVEIKGSYELSSFNDDITGNKKVSLKRVIEQFNIIENGSEISLDRTNKITYVTDFDSPDFIEVNKVNMQIGIKSTYQDEDKKDTSVKAVFLSNGELRSEPNDVELTVFYKDVSEGIPLANAFASLNRLDFIEITGQDNNRANFTYVDIEDKLEDSDPFNEVSSDDKTTRQERVVNGTKKGLEVTGYVKGSIIRGFLTEQEISETASEDPFADNDQSDPFSDDGRPIDISEDDLPF
jgi:hypothetical protein